MTSQKADWHLHAAAPCFHSNPLCFIDLQSEVVVMAPFHLAPVCELIITGAETNYCELLAKFMWLLLNLQPQSLHQKG